MKNSQKGFVVPLLIGIIALLVIGGGVYIYENKKIETPVVADNSTQQSNQVQQTNKQNSPVINQQNTPVIKTTPVSNPAPVKSSVAISSPNGQEVWVNGSQQTIRWTSKGLDATQPVEIILERKSPNDTQFWNIGTIANNQPGSGSYAWTVSSKDTTGSIVANSQYKILIGRNLAKGTGPVDESDGYFLIASPSTVTPNPLSITVISPSAGSVLQVGQPYKITWSGHFERGDEVFGINSFPVGSDTFGTIATVPIAQASCTGAGMGQWANPSTCSYTWTPTGPTPRLQISVFNNKNGNQFGSSGIFSVTTSNSPVIQQNEKIQAYINVVDKNGQPFQATRVWWYYPPVNGAQATEYSATCVNSTCTRWSVTGAVGPRVYTAANYTIKPTPGSLCFTQAYDAKPVDLSSSIAEVTLTLEPGSYCY